MSDVAWVCNQHGCDLPATFRFTWPGRDEAGICHAHAPKLRGVAEALGLHLQLIPLSQQADDSVEDPGNDDD